MDGPVDGCIIDGILALGSFLWEKKVQRRVLCTSEHVILSHMLKNAWAGQCEPGNLHSPHVTVERLFSHFSEFCLCNFLLLLPLYKHNYSHLKLQMQSTSL